MTDSTIPGDIDDIVPWEFIRLATDVLFQIWGGDAVRHQAQVHLTGKARWVHHRSRATRLYAQQQIDEALGDDAEPAVIRFKPPVLDRPQREFLPSANPAFDVTGADGGMQLDLPFGRPIPRDNRPPGGPSPIRGRADEPVAAATTNLSMKPVRNATGSTGTPDGFTLGGLLYGCLIGSATAALILVCLRVLVP